RAVVLGEVTDGDVLAGGPLVAPTKRVVLGHAPRTGRAPAGVAARVARAGRGWEGKSVRRRAEQGGSPGEARVPATAALHLRVRRPRAAPFLLLLDPRGECDIACRHDLIMRLDRRCDNTCCPQGLVAESAIVMDTLEAMRAFVTTVEAGSLAAAAR